MAAGNQGRGQGQGHNQGRDRNNGGGARTGAEGVRERVQGAAQGAKQEAEHVTNRLGETVNAGREELSRRYEEAEGLVAQYPAPAVLLGFGVGFGIGLALTSLLMRREETWAERYLPDSVREIPGRLRNVRVPSEVRDLPDSMHGHLHSLGETLRDLPSAIARVLPGR